ncbi:hypothetical protein METBIDRAFT_170243 [Metschnikowia bicuspidata var. bicuspidata NRRL YB-4993]|uniref:Uncharacterized protein n=1 Tax=Metschnikowia bicuspidata var. bicuspidata NRRL YB-4993 TaxID=869754 RepID=A0A1A0HAS1_9ASCO|nr:hypothetical protein METBIDRAFT_170243 [Metschnikowia bicuspidata var. bicuspidata NRRL YB-4993]OBA20983.1 hypothetical protein METBIDRAFT_170243 [Metschnikowia bicuspidata var. bicuspidata NRRL YB-4993]
MISDEIQSNDINVYGNPPNNIGTPSNHIGQNYIQMRTDGLNRGRSTSMGLERPRQAHNTSSRLPTHSRDESLLSTGLFFLPSIPLLAEHICIHRWCRQSAEKSEWHHQRAAKSRKPESRGLLQRPQAAFPSLLQCHRPWREKAPWPINPGPRPGARASQ